MAGPEFGPPEFSPEKGDRSSDSDDIFRVSAFDLGSGAGVRGPDGIRRIASGRRTSAPRPLNNGTSSKSELRALPAGGTSGRPWTISHPRHPTDLLLSCPLGYSQVQCGPESRGPKFGRASVAQLLAGVGIEWGFKSTSFPAASGKI